jgi:hypothetical protein
VAVHLLKRPRAPQLPVDEVKDIYSSIGPDKVNKSQDTTIIAAVRLSIGCWMALYAAMIVKVVLQHSADWYVRKRMITVGIILMWISTVLKDWGFGGLDAAEWPIHQLVLGVGKTDPREEVYIRARKRLNGRNVLSSIRDLLSSKRLARTRPASASHATHDYRRFQHADAEGFEIEWNLLSPWDSSGDVTRSASRVEDDKMITRRIR